MLVHYAKSQCGLHPSDTGGTCPVADLGFEHRQTVLLVCLGCPKTPQAATISACQGNEIVGMCPAETTLKLLHPASQPLEHFLICP